MTRKMAEQKMHDTENGRKYTYWKMAEKALPENGRTENARHGKWQKMHVPEKGRNCLPGKWQNGKCMTRKMAERKMLDMENGRTENARHGKWQNIHTLENGRKCMPGK